MDTLTIRQNTRTIENNQLLSIYLTNYLKENGYRIVEQEAKDIPAATNHIIAVSRANRKEIIEVRGHAGDFIAKEKTRLDVKKIDPRQHAKHWFSEALLTSFLNFGKYFISEKVALAMALPDELRYRQIIDKVQDYFTANNISFNIYLIADSGDVRKYNLNQNPSKAKTRLFF